MDEHARQQTTVAADNGEAPRRARMPSGNAPFSVCTTNKYPHEYARESERVARVRVRKFWGRTEGRKGCSRGGLIISVIVAVIGAGCQMAHAQQACTFDDGYNGAYISQGGETRQSETCPEYMSCTGANKCSRNIQGIKYCSEVDIDGFCVACQDGHVLGKCGDGNSDYSGDDECTGPVSETFDATGEQFYDPNGFGGCIKCGRNLNCHTSGESSPSDTSGSSCLSGTQGSCKVGTEYMSARGYCSSCPRTKNDCRRGDKDMCACTICAGVVWSSRSTQPCCNQASGQSSGGQSSGGGGEDVKPTCMTTEYYSESQGDCQPCPDGYKCSTWWGPCTQESECKPSKTCPKGKFFDAGDCKQCDSGKTSKPGSTSRDDCVPECPADHYLSKEFGRCQRCAWPKSSPIGSESESDCRKKVCLAGEYLDEDTNGSPVCKSCEQGKTSSAGAERVSSCKSECVKGMFLNAQSECTHCGKDQCGVAMTTQFMGATSSSMCIEDVSLKKEFGELCDSHDQCRKMVNDAQIATCTCQIHCCGSLGMSTGCIECADDGDCAVCEAGYYLGWKYNIPTRNWCEKCPEGKTSKRGSTSSDDCGYGPNAAGDDCPNGRFDCVLGQCRGGICCSDLGSEPGTLSCAEDTGNGKSCDFGYYLGRSYYIGGHVCKKCADDKTTVDTGSTSDDDCVTKFVDGEACSINSQCASNSCKGGVCCNLQKDSPECTECDANKGYCAGCKSGFVLNTQEDSPDNGGDQKQNPFVCVACYPGTTSTDGARDAWNTWDYANNKLSFPPYGYKKVCLPDLKAGDVCDKKEQCLSYKCQKHCCKEFYKLCASCNENGLCEKCEAYSYMTEDGTCKLCGTDADGNFAYADAGSTDPSACFFKMSIDNGGKCRFDQAEACKSGDCRVNCCTESIDGCLKCGTNGACSECDDNYFMEDEYSVCKDSNFEEEKEREFLAQAGICQEGETCNFDCSQWKNNYNGDCNNDIRSDEGYPLMRELCPAFCQRCDNKICTACPKYTTSKRGANIGDGSCKKIDDGKTCFTDESCTSGVCKGSCCSSSYKNKDCIKCGSDGQCEQCGESWLDSDQCCTSTDAPYSGCSVPDCTAINNPIACKPQVCTARDEPYKGCIIPDCTAVNSPFAGCNPQACTAKDTPYKGCVETKAWCTESSDCGAGQVCSGESNVCPKWCPLEWESDPTSFSKGCTDMDGETSTVTINSEERLRCSKGCKCCKFQEESDSTASQTENQVVILKTVLRGVSASTFNGDSMLISAFKATVASLLVDVSLSDIYDVEAQDTLSDRRRRLDSVPSCTVNYKIRATSQVVADAASKKAEALTSVEFTKMLRENMNDLNVKSVPSSSVYAEILPKETDSLGEKKFSGSQSSDSTTISSSTSTNSKEEEAGGEGGAGLAIAMVFIFVVLPSIAAGLAYWKRDYLREKWTEYRKTKSSPVKTSTTSLEMMAVNPTFARKLGGDKAGHESVEIFPENDDMPKLYALLKQLTMAAWINKFVLHGIHTTEMLLSDVDSDVLIELGMRSQQRRRLLSKMEELRGSQEVVDSNYELTDREKHADEEVARGGWQRRFSVVAGREYFENSLTGDTQFERPETFEGTSKEDTEETETDVTGGEAEKHLRGNANSGDSSEAPPSLQEQLKHARLPEDLLSKIEAEFDGDIAAVSDDWIAAQTLPRLKVRRLEALRAKARGVLWYHGKTGDYDFWMNASTDEYQYMPPETEGSYIMPAPRNYFEDCKADLASHDEAEKKKKIDDSVAATAAAKWRRARAKIKTIQRIKALKNIQAK